MTATSIAHPHLAPTLGETFTGRDNNLNLVRALAATGVLVSHAWPIALGPEAVEPLEGITGRSLGSLCVSAFFTISGALIARSWQSTPDWRAFLASRTLRLYPGLAVSLLLVAFVMAPWVSTLGASGHLAQPEAASFVWRNLLLVKPQYTLPGVFEGNPLPAVEGSIWTLVHEVACYLGVLAAGLAGLLATRRRAGLALGLVGAAWVVIALAQVPLHPMAVKLHHLAAPFVIGVAFWVWRGALLLDLRLTGSSQRWPGRSPARPWAGSRSTSRWRMRSSGRASCRRAGSDATTPWATTHTASTSTPSRCRG